MYKNKYIINILNMNHFNSTELIKNKEFFNQLDNILICTFCHGFLVNPRECSGCQISFCNDCIKSWDDNKKNNYSCPMRCEKNIFVKPHRNTVQMLEKLEIKCFRCSKYVNYNELEDHVENQCEKLKIDCSHTGCTEKISKHSIADHLRTCEYGVTECEECGQNTIRKNIKKIIDSNRKMIKEKDIEIGKHSNEIYNLKQNIEIYKKEIENFKQYNETLKKQYDDLKGSNESLLNENENLKKTKEIMLIKEKESVEISKQSIQNKIENLNKKNALIQRKVIKKMLEVIDEDEVQFKSIDPIPNVMNEILNLSGVFLKEYDFKILFKKLLLNHNKVCNDDSLNSIELVIRTMFKTHRKLFDNNKSLTLDVVGKFIDVYPLNSNSRDDKIIKGLRVLIKILKFLRQDTTDMYFNKILKNLPTFLEKKEPKLRKLTCKILKIFEVHPVSEFNLYINDNLKALNTAINYSSEGQEKDEWADAKDYTIAAMGNVIYHRYNNLDVNIWIPQWFSFFTLDLDLKQTKSYSTLCDFLSDYLNLEEHVSKVLFGNNRENFPKILRLVANFYESKYSTDELNYEIRIIFDHITNDPSLQEFVRLAKENCEPKILEKLKILFP
jgi:hypothetical protein